MSTNIGIVILAAGVGSRMRIDYPKPLVQIMGRRLIDFVIAQSKEVMNSDLAVSLSIVVKYQMEKVKNYISSRYSFPIEFIVQGDQLGTGEALKAYVRDSSHFLKNDYTLVMYSDTPLIQSEDIIKLIKSVIGSGLDGGLASFNIKYNKGYGRVVRERKGFRIVEEKDATDEQRQIQEVNSGIYILKNSYIKNSIDKIESKNNAQEFYLTDIFNFNDKTLVINFGNIKNFYGINTFYDLELITRLVSERKNISLMNSGVKLLDSRHTHIEYDVSIGVDTEIARNVHILGNSKILEKCIIEPGVIIKDSIVNKEVHIKAYSYIENSVIGKNSVIGPFARLRPEANIGSKSKIGNFVEVKKSDIGEKVSISHLSYVGDAKIGDNTNIGCGFITCNYDGDKKHKTTIGKDCFIGSDSQTIAPVDIGDDCYVASGSTINKDMSDESFAIARSRQVTKEGMAKRFIKKK